MISVIIPCYNESLNIAAAIAKCDAWLGARQYDCEIIIVDDGSSDGTAEIAEKTPSKTKKRVIRQAVHRGKGAAVRTGMLASRGDFVLFTDADFSTGIEELGKFLEEAKNGADVVIASRHIPGSVLRPPQPFFRRMIGIFCRWLVKIIAVRGYSDTQCGFKLFSRRAANLIFPELSTEGFSFDVEILMSAAAKGLRIAEMPVVWSNSESSRVSPLKDSLKFFIQLFKLRKKYKTDGSSGK